MLAKLARGETIDLPQGEAEKSPLLLPDARRNPAYLHFALKTLLATLLCYVFYTAADWQGIHTIMLSCVIVAQPGLGATMQKNPAAYRRRAARHAAGAIVDRLCTAVDRVHRRPTGDGSAGNGALGVDCRRVRAYCLRRDPNRLLPSRWPSSAGLAH